MLANAMENGRDKPHRVRELSQRDYQILEHISWGPTNVWSIGRRFFPAKENDPGTQHGISAYVWERLRMLQSAGYMEMRKVNNIRRLLRSDSPIVVIKDKGATEVALHFNYDIDNIKPLFPRLAEVAHDIMVASVTRKFIEEARQDLYKIDYIHTEHYLRKVHGKFLRTKRGDFFPDCRIRIVPNQGPALTLDVEIDGGSKGRSQLYNKIASFSNAVLIITPNSDRLLTVVRYLCEGEAKIKKLSAPQVWLEAWEDFIKKGCRSRNVVNFSTANRDVLPVVVDR
jgi:hypothetical protein